MSGRIGYLCLQATREGQASHAHVHHIIEGLEEFGWTISLHQPDYAESSTDPGLWPRLKEFVRVQVEIIRSASRYDLLYIRSHFAAFPTVLSAKIRGIPVVREVNGSYEDLFIAWPATRLVAPLFRWIMGVQLRWSDVVITVSEGLTDWVRREGARGTVCMIPAGADVRLFHPDADTDRELPDRYVIFFGALVEWQGISTLLRATDDPAWPEDVKLVVAGDGELRASVESKVGNGRVVYLGTVPYRSMPGIVAGSIAGLSPQVDLGGRASFGLYPLKVFETMACGVPVVVTDFPGQADLVEEESCGIVVPEKDPAAIARAVRDLAVDPDLAEALGSSGRRAAVRGHSWQKRAEATHRILRDLTSPPRVNGATRSSAR